MRKTNSLLTFSRDSIATTAYLRVSTGTQGPPSSCKSRSQRRPSPRLSASASQHLPLYQGKAVTPTPSKDIFTPIWAGSFHGLSHFTLRFRVHQIGGDSTNEAGQPTTMQNTGFTTTLQFDNQAAQLAPSSGTHWSDPDMPRQFETKSGAVAKFTWRVS
jgi:hypothetical protein